jgi:CheY-like chemotaxis protein
VRVAIAEDSVLLREGLARLLGEGGFEVVAQCEDADDFLLKVRSFPPDVAIVDIRLPPTHNDEGLRAALEIREKHPAVGVLVLSQYVELGLALSDRVAADSASFREGASWERGALLLGGVEDRALRRPERQRIGLGPEPENASEQGLGRKRSGAGVEPTERRAATPHRF